MWILAVERWRGPGLFVLLVLFYRIAVPTLPAPLAIPVAVLETGYARLPQCLTPTSLRGMQPVPGIVEVIEGRFFPYGGMRAGEVLIPVQAKLNFQIVDKLCGRLFGVPRGERKQENAAHVESPPSRTLW